MGNELVWLLIGTAVAAAALLGRGRWPVSRAVALLSWHPRSHPGRQSGTLPCRIFSVVGQHREAPERLLLQGDDGRYYATDRRGQPTPVEPTADWVFDAGPHVAGAEAVNAGSTARSAT